MTLLLLLAGLAHAELRVEGDLRVGAEMIVAVVDEDDRPVSGRGVRVIHRPGMTGETQVTVGLTDSLGRVRYTPTLGGEALIRAGDEQARVHVEWTSPPAAPVLHVAVALALAMALVLYGVRRPEIPT